MFTMLLLLTTRLQFLFLPFLTSPSTSSHPPLKITTPDPTLPRGGRLKRAAGEGAESGEGDRASAG
eukprot:2164084-Rhodomonas_salina.2